MGRYAGLGDVRANKTTPKWLQGQYRVKITGVRSFVSRAGKDTFVIEGKNLTSTNPERPVGMVCSQLITILPEILETTLGDIKQFLCAALDIDDEENFEPPEGQTQNEFFEDSLELITSKDQPLAASGLELNLVVVDIPKKRAPSEMFPKHTWSRVD